MFARRAYNGGEQCLVGGAKPQTIDIPTPNP
jgi:hypothetical protein